MDEKSLNVNDLLTRFDDLINGLAGRFDIETLAPRVHVICPRDIAARKSSGRDVSLTVSALLHGVEVAGLAVLVETLTVLSGYSDSGGIYC